MAFVVNLTPVALPILLKVKFNFEVIMYITIFVFLYPKTCFNCVISRQNLLESALIFMFSRRLWEQKHLHQKGLWALYSLIFRSEAT